MSSGGGDKMEDEEDQVIEQPAIEDPATDEQEDDDTPVQISLGDEPEAVVEEDAPAPQWVKDLRKSHRELLRENRELKQRVTPAVQQQQVIQLGKKPQIGDDDIAYDADKFEQALLEWNEQKRQIELQKRQVQEQSNKMEQDWQNTLHGYQTAKSKLRVDDFDEAEAVIQDTLSPEQQGIILHAAATPAALIYALGKNPKEVKALAEIRDPVKFAYAVSKMEATKLRVTKKESIPAPERRVVGSSPISGGSDAALERLRKEAEKSGDFSKVVAYKKSRQK